MLGIKQALNAMNSRRQTIRYLTTPDNVRLAWAKSGNGPALVKAANWITHLEYDWESPVWHNWIDFLSGHFTTIRFDERGNGLSQHDVKDVSYPNWLPDLECVVDAAELSEPFILLGISQGSIAAVEFAVKYSERVSHLILYGGYARGINKRGHPDGEREYQAIVEFTELGWGRPNPIYRRLFTQRFLPKGTEEQMSWFDEHCATTTSPAMAAELLRSRVDVDITDQLEKVSVPTLVLHATKDHVAPLWCGQELAAGIPGAEFVQLDSWNHVLLEDEPAWQQFQDVVLEFAGAQRAHQAESFADLSERECEILAQIVAGKTNQEIGDALFISEKTVRNHITQIYSKLGVKTRAQAMVRARDDGFGR